MNTSQGVWAIDWAQATKVTRPKISKPEWMCLDWKWISSLPERHGALLGPKNIKESKKIDALLFTRLEAHQTEQSSAIEQLYAGRIVQLLLSLLGEL